MRVAVVQINSQEDKAANIDTATRLVEEAARRGARLVALPELFTFQGPEEEQQAAAEPIPGPTSRHFGRLARDLGIYLHAGSFYETGPASGKFYNTSLLFDPQGEPIARYRKVHLFDVDVVQPPYRESNTVLGGDELVTARVDGRVAGLSICYDLRFPELYRALAVFGAELVFVPASFAMETGRDHWHVLLRARAIENQCFVIAAGQTGVFEGTRQTYGHSLIVDPWGTVLAEMPDEVGIATADLDFERLARIRERLPSLRNRRPEVYAAAEGDRRPAAVGVAQ